MTGRCCGSPRDTESPTPAGSRRNARARGQAPTVFTQRTCSSTRARPVARARVHLAHGLDREWWAHASRIFHAATRGQLERIDFLPALLPEIDSERVALLQTLSGTRVGGGGGSDPISDAAAAVVFTPSPPPPESLGQRIHLYALCWNDARMLPFFFRHYDPWVQRYVIFDDGSTDGSLELLRAHPRVEVRRFVRTHPESFVLSELAHYDHCWKASRGEADWIFLCDVDEHLFHPIYRVSRSMSLCGVTAVPTIGCEMVSDVFPEDTSGSPCREHLSPCRDMCKLSVFRPAPAGHRFAPGGHSACPVGRNVAAAHACSFALQDARSRLRGHTSCGAGQPVGPERLEQDWGHQWTARGDALSAVFENWRSRLDLHRKPMR